MEIELLRKLQDVELSTLVAIDDFCRKYEIKYSLYAGTMLGAIRHSGFIPWDDDVDIAMTRPEYAKFCEAIRTHPLEGHFFESYETDRNCGICHGKVRRLNTLFLQHGDIESVGHHEVWVDIFPLDKIPIGRGAGKVKRIGMRAVLLARANVVRLTDNRGLKALRVVLRMIPEDLRRRLLISGTKTLEDNSKRIEDEYEWVSMSTLGNINSVRFPKSVCESYKEVPFQDHSFMSFRDTDKMLTILYGDYMKLPPLEERVCRHNPVKLVVDGIRDA